MSSCPIDQYVKPARGGTPSRPLLKRHPFGGMCLNYFR